MQYLKEAVTILSPFCHHFVTIFRCHHFPVMNSRKDHEKLCVHIRNMHRYLHRVRKEIDNELAKTYRKKCTMESICRQTTLQQSSQVCINNCIKLPYA